MSNENPKSVGADAPKPEATKVFIKLRHNFHFPTSNAGGGTLLAAGGGHEALGDTVLVRGVTLDSQNRGTNHEVSVPFNVIESFEIVHPPVAPPAPPPEPAQSSSPEDAKTKDEKFAGRYGSGPGKVHAIPAKEKERDKRKAPTKKPARNARMKRR